MTIRHRSDPERSILDNIDDPAALRALTVSQLNILAREIRAFLIEKVCATGGHLGANLGVVELTIALHRVFDSPRDVLLFDTGHQSYVHKILTRRRAGFDSLRHSGGLSGYPMRAESTHDWIENSHASTALSYADGIATARALDSPDQDGAQRCVVAVIGDGALTGGLAWEGLNNLADAPDRPVVVVLNDNGRSYAPTIGGIAHHLQDLRGGTGGETLFQHLGLAYLGPIDGHDITELETALRAARGLGRTAVVHCVTAKGRGYAHAEADDADRMHGIGVLDPATGAPAVPAARSWTDVFGAELAALGADRPDVVAITAAMSHPVGLAPFARRFPERVVDVGIAEQQAVCGAAGLAMAGRHPVVAVYATFLTRAVDQVLLDVALHRLGVTIVLDRAGITGPDGPSHHGLWDIALLSVVPGLRLAAPRDPTRLRELLREALAVSDAPTVVRYPKASVGADIEQIARMDGLDVLYRGRRLALDVLIVAVGPLAQPALHAAVLLTEAGIGATVVDPRWVLPIHPILVHLSARHRLVVTVEDGVRHGGVGAALASVCAEAGSTTPVHALGLPTAFIRAGDRAALLAEYGLTGPAIARTVQTRLETLLPVAGEADRPNTAEDDDRSAGRPWVDLQWETARPVGSSP